MRDHFWGGAFLSALVGVSLITAVGAQSRRALDADFTLSSVSPLATDGRALFAVADDGRTILTRPIGSRTWTSTGAVSPAPITAMTMSPTALLVADTTGVI